MILHLLIPAALAFTPDFGAGEVIPRPDDLHPWLVFGRSVATADIDGDGVDELIVGAPDEDGGGPPGRTVVFDPPDPPQVLGDDLNVSESYGRAVSFGADVDGDGRDEFLTGYSAGFTNETGQALLHYGPGTDVPEEIEPSDYDQGDQLGFGHDMVGLEDVNGDGYSDIAVSRAYGDVTPALSSVYVFQGGPNGIGPETKLSPDDGQPGGYFGFRLVGGDFDGNERTDLAVYSLDTPQDTGAVYVYLAADEGIQEEHTLKILPPEGADNLFGKDLATGDLDCDGYDDLMVTAWRMEVYPPEDDREFLGGVFVYFGSREGLPSEPDLLVAPNDKYDTSSGRAVASGGDVNGDEYEDFVVISKPIGYGPRVAHVFYGGPREEIGEAETRIVAPPDASEDFGMDQAQTLGDLNGDGVDDVVIADVGRRIYVFSGACESPDTDGTCPPPPACVPDDVLAEDTGDTAVDVDTGEPPSPPSRCGCVSTRALPGVSLSILALVMFRRRR